MSDLPLSPDDVAEIVAILDGGAYDHLDIRTARFALRIAREGDGWTQEWTPIGADEPAVAVAPARAETARPEEEGGVGVAVPPPLPGTFYRAPQPGAPPFVEVGAHVEADTVVGIIETMKLMNPVYAGVAGTVTVIVAENAALVAADAVLMRVAPDA